MPIIDPIQSWGPIPNEVTYTYNAGTLTPAITPITFIIEDVEGVPENDIYSDFRLFCIVQYESNAIQWMVPSSYNSNGYPTTSGSYIPYSNRMDFNFTPSFQNLASLPIGEHVFYHYFGIQGLLSSGSWYPISYYEYAVKINVTGVVENPVVSFSPATIAFSHQQNATLPTKSISMTGDLWKIVGKPNFLLTSPTAGVTITSVTDGTGTYQTASGSGNGIVTIALTSYYNTDITFPPEALSGSFSVLENNVAFGTIAFSVSVVRMSDFLTIPYLSTSKAFTLDTKFFEFTSMNLDTYFQFDALIKTYDFFTNAVNEYTIPQKVVLYKSKAKLNLGRTIHRLMRKFDTVNETLLQYKYATLKVTCTEKKISDNTVIRTVTSPDITFVAGLSRGITNFGFLDFNPKPNRVTKNSFAYLNILIPAGNYEIRVLKNGTQISTVALPAATDKIICKKVLFSDYAQGDVIQYVLDVVGETNALAPKKSFILYPAENYSNMIVWENEFLLQSAIECTGSASLSGDIEQQSQKVYSNLVETLEHISSSKEVKLNINTGWLLFTDIDTVESLMRSKRAWLIQGDNEISLRPISKKLPVTDLEQELISYSLEFTINRTYDEETYTL